MVAENAEHRPNIGTEANLGKLDALIVLGKNIGVDWTKKNVESAYLTHLSPHSRINVLVAGLLYQEGLARKIIFSTGYTAGKELPSEAQAMKNHLKKFFPSIPDADILLEEDSWDTNTNAKAVKRKLKQYGLKTSALVTVGFHMQRALYLFQRSGLVVEDLFRSEEELEDKFPRYVEKYLASQLVAKEKVKEANVFNTQQKISPELISLVTWGTRNRTLSGLRLLAS